MGRIARDLKQGEQHEDGDRVKMPMSKPRRKDSASEEWRLRALRRVVALFAALVVSLTLTAAASADVSFTKAYGWGVLDGANQFETCTSTCQAGLAGAGAGQFTYPADVATDSSGDVYVTDWENDRIEEFSAAGAFIKTIGTYGGGAGQFAGPEGVATDSSGDVYVADSGNYRIDEFSAAGAFVKAYGWGVGDPMNQPEICGSSQCDQFETCTSSCQTGIEGSGAGQFSNWSDGIAIDRSGDVYVADTGNDRIEEFSAAGAFIRAFGTAGSGAGQFAEGPYGGVGPYGVATDPSGDIYAADPYNARIDEFSAAGTFIKAYGWGVSDGVNEFETCARTCQAGTEGIGAGQLNYPFDVATDSSGDVYVADQGNERIDEFSAAGAFIKAYGWGVLDGKSQLETCTSTCQDGSSGGGAGQFFGADGVAIDPSGDVYVAAGNNSRIDEFSGAGPTPTLTSLSPQAGPIAGGTPVVVTGSGFGNRGDADTVTFVPEGGGAPISAVNPVVVSETEIDLTTPDVSAFYSGGVFHTNVQVTTDEASTSTIGLSGQFNFPATVVEMGDSIAAGEGTLDGFFYSPTNGATGLWSGGVANAPGFGPYPECHDSGYAYGQLLSAALRTNFVTLACTGASYAEGIVGPEVFKSHLSANVTVPAQFPSSTYEKAQPDAVVMTYGADDVQFSSIAKLCIASALASSPRTESIVAEAALGALLTGNPGLAALLETALAADAGPEQCTQSNPGSTVDTDFTEYLPKLKESYAQIVSKIETQGRKASPPRVPKIIITNYMDPFPPNGVGCADTWPLDNAQLSYFNTLFTALNSTIRSAVIRLNNPNVSFVDISKALGGHTWCTSEPWDYGLSVNLQSGVLNLVSDAPFHPTPAGQAAMARLVQPVVAVALGLNGTGATVTSADGSGSADGITVEPGESISAEASGFAPDEIVEETLHSSPLALGSVMTNGDGDISTAVTVPLGTPAGQHELLFTGQTSGVTATLLVLIPAPPAGPVFTTDSPPQTVPSGGVYAGDFGASGVPAPTYALAPGAPAWLSIEPSFSGIVSGTPPSGTTSFTYSVIASNGVGPVATAGPFTVTVTAGSESLAGSGALAGSGLTRVLGAKEETKAPATGSTSLDGSAITVQRNHEALIKLTCTGAATCSGRLTLTVKRTTGKGKKRHTKTQTIGTATFSVAAGKSAIVKLTLNGTGRALLSAAHGHLSATLTIFEASPSPSNTQTHGVHLAQQKTKAKKGKK